MENPDRIKALNILLYSAAISLFVCGILAVIISDHMKISGPFFAILGPIVTYIVGRFLCFKEYKD